MKKRKILKFEESNKSLQKKASNKRVFILHKNDFNQA